MARISRRRWNEARAVAEEAARQATEASAMRSTELRRLQEEMSERLAESETSTRAAPIETAVEEVRSETSTNRAARAKRCWKKLCARKRDFAKRVGAVDELKAPSKRR
jgi:F0F1-type ATP synthase membrane subunit b/b'